MRVYRNEKNLGYRANFMKAAGLCASDLIAFCDQDDVWLPQKLEKCAAAFDNEQVLLSYHNVSVVSSTLEPLPRLGWIRPLPPLSPPLSIGPAASVFGFTMVFRRVLLKFEPLWTQSGRYDDLNAPESHDDWFFFLASCLGTVAYTPECLALYRQHGSNASIAKDMSRFQKLGKKIEVLRSMFGDDLSDLAKEQAFFGKRSNLLETLQRESDGHFQERAAAAAALYRKFSVIFLCRRAIWRSSQIGSRFKTFNSLRRAGCYRPKVSWGCGRKALFRDFVRGVCFPSFLTQ